MRPLKTGSAAVIDASCLINLWHLNLLSKLIIRYNRVYVPRHVVDETRRKGRRWHRFRELVQALPFLEICDAGNPCDAQLLYDRNLNPSAPIDRGEAEAIIQARERGIGAILIDDLQGRRLAEQHSLQVRGTIGLLIEFKKIGFIKAVRPLVETLRRDLHFRISEELLTEQLKEVDE